jgi:hypothetical protein
MALKGIVRKPERPVKIDEMNPYAQPASHWNYRVLEFTAGEESWRAIHEGYYRNGVPMAYTADAATIQWDLDDGDGAALTILDRMRDAISKPVLREVNFGSTGS